MHPGAARARGQFISALAEQDEGIIQGRAAANGATRPGSICHVLRCLVSDTSNSVSRPDQTHRHLYAGSRVALAAPSPSPPEGTAPIIHSRAARELASRHYERLRPAVPVLATGVAPADEKRPDGLRGARYLASEKSTTHDMWVI